MNGTYRLALALLLVGLAASPALAQVRSLEEGPIVRRQLLFRSDRLEVAPGIGHTLNDPYRRTLFIEASLNYHLTNVFSLGLTAGWGAINYNTNVLDNIESANPAVARTLDFADRTLLANFHVAYVPFYGKFNVLDTTTIHYDFHLIGGVCGALLSADNGRIDDLSGFKFGPAFGAGFRFFFNGDTAFTFDVVDHMFSSADIARLGTPVEEEFSHNVMVSLAVSFFVTGELRVSR
jgi:outer membrane beta-barrel protein